MRAACLALLLFVAGCEIVDSSGEPPLARLTTDRATYAPPDTLVLRIENLSDREIGFNVCSALIERRTDAGVWVEVREERICTRELQILEAGQTAAARRPLPPQVIGGLSRLRLRVQTMGEADDVSSVSNTFQIVAVRF